MDNTVEEIKSKLNVEEVIGGYLQLNRAGRNFKACCPFHNEKTPSFMISPERQSWHCFGCGEGGDIFTFVMKMEGVSFVDALKILAEKAGVEIKTNYKKKKNDNSADLLGVLDVSKKFYQQCLKIKGGKKAYEYLLERGLSEESIDKFELGFAPDSWNLLSEYLLKKGFSEKEIFDAGMTVRRDNTSYYDRFRGRIMFPVNSISGQTVGFSSRVMPGADESVAKYINTPETLVYNKGRVLYGLDKAKVSVRSKDECIMVEGNMDVIASHQAGVENVVATSGTALTSEQIRIIKRYTDNIIFSFDADSAGVKAAGRAIDLALEEGMNVDMIQIEEGKDPADCVQRDPKLWQECVEKKVKIMDFYFNTIFAKYDKNDIDGKKKIADELLEIIVKISNKIEQSFYLQKLSSEIGINEGVLSAIMKEKGLSSNRRNSFKDRQEINEHKEESKENKLQARILGSIIVNPEIFKDNFLELEEFFSDDKMLSIYKKFLEFNETEKKFNEETLKKIRDSFESDFSEKDVDFSGDDILKEYDKIAFSVERNYEDDEAFDVKKDAEKCILNLKKILVENQLRKVPQKIREAKKNKDFELEAKLIQDQTILSQKLNEVAQKLNGA